MICDYSTVGSEFVTTHEVRGSNLANFLVLNEGSGCSSVGRVVAFDTRGPRFNSSHMQNFIGHLFVNLVIINCIEKTKINKKKPGMAHFFKKPSRK